MNRGSPLQATPDDTSSLTWKELTSVYRRFFIVAGLLLVFGLIRLPLENRLTKEHHAAHFGNVQLNRNLRERVGQVGFLAALSGFRTLVADLLWIDANTAWQRVEYGRMNLLLSTVTTLAPRNVSFWDESSWHMAYNASRAAMDDLKQPKVAARLIAQRGYFMLGKDYAERGIANNPDAYVLHQSLGNIYRDKLQDHCRAAEAYAKAAGCPNPPSYEKRFAAYELSQCPGHEMEAWRQLRTLYDMGPQERLPTLEKDLKEMEDQLKLPADQRVYPLEVKDPLKAVEEKLQVLPEQRVYKTP